MTDSTTMAGSWLKPSEALNRTARPAPLTNATATRTRDIRFGYRIGPMGFLVGTGVLSELLPASTTYPIPNVPPSVRGYVNRQGALVPVWDLRRLLMLDSEDALVDKESILLLGRGEQRVGVIVEGLPRSLKKLQRVATPPQLPKILESYVQDVYFADDVLWHEFDYTNFFRAQTETAAAN